MSKDAKGCHLVRHPEFACLQHQIAIAFIGSQLTITLEDRKAFLEQIEAEQDSYDAIKELHDKIIRLLGEEYQAKGATNHR